MQAEAFLSRTRVEKNLQQKVCGNKKAAHRGPLFKRGKDGRDVSREAMQSSNDGPARARTLVLKRILEEG